MKVCCQLEAFDWLESRKELVEIGCYNTSKGSFSFLTPGYEAKRKTLSVESFDSKLLVSSRNKNTLVDVLQFGSTTLSIVVFLTATQQLGSLRTGKFINDFSRTETLYTLDPKV